MQTLTPGKSGPIGCQRPEEVLSQCQVAIKPWPVTRLKSLAQINKIDLVGRMVPELGKFQERPQIDADQSVVMVLNLGMQIIVQEATAHIRHPYPRIRPRQGNRLHPKAVPERLVEAPVPEDPAMKFEFYRQALMEQRRGMVMLQIVDLGVIRAQRILTTQELLVDRLETVRRHPYIQVAGHPVFGAGVLFGRQGNGALEQEWFDAMTVEGSRYLGQLAIEHLVPIAIQDPQRFETLGKVLRQCARHALAPQRPRERRGNQVMTGKLTHTGPVDVTRLQLIKEMALSSGVRGQGVGQHPERV